MVHTDKSLISSPVAESRLVKTGQDICSSRLCQIKYEKVCRRTRSTHSPRSGFAGGTCSWSARSCASLDPPLSGEGSGALTVGDTKVGLSVLSAINGALSKNERGSDPISHSVFSRPPTGLALTQTLPNPIWVSLPVNYCSMEET